MVVLVIFKNKEDSIKLKALERSQQYSLIFQTLKGSLLRSQFGILPKFKLIQAFTAGLVNCKNEGDPSKNESTRVVTTFHAIISLWGFFKMLKGS